MADIRINSLPSTATSFNTDDYIAIDGASGGTRKMLAATLPLTDVTLGGTSGPSVKSTLSARAPRQGLVFDGTFNSSISTAVPAFGTNDFSVAAIVNTDLSVNLAGIIGSNTTGGFGLFLYNSGVVNVQHIGIATIGSSTGAISANKSTLVVYTRSGTTGTFYINGVAAGTITDGSGGTPTNYSQTTNLLGQVGGLNIIKGTVAPLIYNRALSASEVVSLYEAGAPAGADYASGGAANSVYTTNFSSDTGWSLDTGVTISGNKLNLANNAYAGAPVATAIVKGTQYRFTITVDSVTSGANVSYYNGSSYVAFATAAGTYTVTFTAAGNYPFFIFNSFGNAGAVVDNFTFDRVGLLLAPDAAQAGGGLVWYDTSGNAANISWTSGVSWNVPSSRVLGGNWTTSGTLGVNKVAGGEASVASTLQITSPAVSETGAGGLEWKADVANNGYGFRTLPVFNGVSSYDLYTQSRSNSASWTTRMSLTNSGNLLIGTTTDSANGKLQLATHSSYTGGIGFGTDTSLFRAASGNLGLYGTGTSSKITFSHSTTTAGKGFEVECDSAKDGYIWNRENRNIFFGTNNTLALTLDSSQNATFAGKVGIGVSPASWELNLKQSAVNSAVRIISPTALGLNDSSIYIAWASGSKALIAASYESTGSYRPLVLSAGGVDSLTLDTSGNSTFAGNIKTAAPSGGTAATWRLGTVASVSPTSPNRTIEVEIGGTTYYIHAKTTNN